MKITFSAEQFFEIFKKYNEAVFPMQIIFYMIAIISLYLVVKPNSFSSKIISGILAFVWLWMGIFYQLTFFSSINKAAYLFGAAFILQGILFIITGLIKINLSFHLHPDMYGITGIVLILYALLIYPVLSYLNNHIYPYSPTLGLPCPTTIFTFGILLMSEKKIPMSVLIIPIFWSFIGFTAVFQFGVVEDTGLLIAGLLSFILSVMHNKKLTIANINSIDV